MINELKINGMERFSALSDKLNQLRKLDMTSNLRNLDISKKLNISEAELLSLELGNNTNYLKIECFSDFFYDLKIFQEVMFLTRNEEVVHEKIVNTKDLYISSNDANLVNYLDNPLIIFSNNFFRFVFAESRIVKGREMNSFQFFNDMGIAVLKIYIRDKNIKNFQILVDSYKVKYRYQVQGVPRALVNSVSKRGVDLFKSVMVKNFLNCTSYKRYYINTKNILRLILKEASDNKIDLGIYVISSGSMQFHIGNVKKIKDYGGWFNVLDGKFNLHAKDSKIENSICVYISSNSNDYHLHFYNELDNCCLGIYSICDNQSMFLKIKSLIT